MRTLKKATGDRYANRDRIPWGLGSEVASAVAVAVAAPAGGGEELVSSIRFSLHSLEF